MRNWRSLVGLLALLTMVPLAMAATWVGECPTIVPSARLLDTVSNPQGISRYLVVADTRLPNCDMQRLPIVTKNIQAGRIISPSVAVRLNQGFALSYEGAADGLKQAEIVPRDDPPQSNTPLILGNDLLAEISVLSFGGEERVTGSLSSMRVTLSCRAGHRTAGLLLRIPSSHSLPKEVPTAIRLQYESKGEFAVGISDERRLVAEDPLIFAKIYPDKPNAELVVPANGFDKNHLNAITILCPSTDATLSINQLSVEPVPRGKTPISRATWLWNPNEWRNATDFRFQSLINHGIKVLFITVPVDLVSGEVEHANQLAAFITTARQAGIEVWAVLGDPQAVIDSERGKFTRMARAYDYYNRHSPPDAQLAGIQYDIEPYLNRGYEIDATPWLAAYIATLHELKKAANLPIDFAVPFFWASEKSQQGLLLDEITPFADSLTVMAYRTDPSQIRAFAQPFLEWGSRTHREVRIALEAGPIADSRLLHYAPANAGRMALLESGKYGALLELVDSVDATSLRTFQQYRFSTHSGGTVSFAMRQQELLDLVPELEKQWSKWPAFSGVALHEFLSNGQR
ncbi:MAG: hypothetical protein RIR18_1652 [Pseudomonadota bacterium]|jgi:hypothetical protein